jgi:hypothetical protein
VACNKIFNSSKYAKVHAVMAHTKARIQCKMWGKEWQNVYAFRKHVYRAHHISGVPNVVEVYGVMLEAPETV